MINWLFTFIIANGSSQFTWSRALELFTVKERSTKIDREEAASFPSLTSLWSTIHGMENEYLELPKPTDDSESDLEKTIMRVAQLNEAHISSRFPDGIKSLCAHLAAHGVKPG